MFGLGKKAGKGLVGVGKSAVTGTVGVGKSAVTGTVSTGIAVASTPTRAITKAKVVSDSHDASYYSEDASGTGQSLDYFVDGYTEGSSNGQTIRLSRLHGKPLRSSISFHQLASTSLPLIIDDIGFGNTLLYNSIQV